MLFALRDDAPMGLTLHHVAPALDAGDIVHGCVCAIPVVRGDGVGEVIRAYVEVTAELWVRGLKSWDGVSTSGVAQAPELLLEENKECHRAPKTEEELAELVALLEDKLGKGDYSWYETNAIS